MIGVQCYQGLLLVVLRWGLPPKGHLKVTLGSLQGQNCIYFAAGLLGYYRHEDSEMTQITLLSWI